MGCNCSKRKKEVIPGVLRDDTPSPKKNIETPLSKLVKKTENKHERIKEELEDYVYIDKIKQE